LPKTLVEFIRKRQIENDLSAKQLGDITDVSEDTIPNFKSISLPEAYPSSQRETQYEFL
jgi:hypothetical protein